MTSSRREFLASCAAIAAGGPCLAPVATLSIPGMFIALEMAKLHCLLNRELVAAGLSSKLRVSEVYHSEHGFIAGITNGQWTVTTRFPPRIRGVWRARREDLVNAARDTLKRTYDPVSNRFVG